MPIPAKTNMTIVRRNKRLRVSGGGEREEGGYKILRSTMYVQCIVYCALRGMNV